MTSEAYEPERAIDAAEDGHGHAVVLGAGIAGLLAARVLAETFDRVTVIDRDILAGADVRRGVPQGRHPHLLLDRGRQIMEELFPGLTAALVARGAATKVNRPWTGGGSGPWKDAVTGTNDHSLHRTWGGSWVTNLTRLEKKPDLLQVLLDAQPGCRRGDQSTSIASPKL